MVVLLLPQIQVCQSRYPTYSQPHYSIKLWISNSVLSAIIITDAYVGKPKGKTKKGSGFSLWMAGNSKPKAKAKPKIVAKKT